MQSIKRKLPDKLIINIKERQEKCIIPYLGSYVFLDDEARVLKIEEFVENIDIPIMTGINISSFTIGEKVDFEQREKIALLTDIMSSLEKADVSSYISEVNVSDMRNIVIFTVDGTEVLVGDDNDLFCKFSMLMSALEDMNLRKDNSEYVLDISVCGQAVLKPKNE